MALLNLPAYSQEQKTQDTNVLPEKVRFPVGCRPKPKPESLRDKFQAEKLIKKIKTPGTRRTPGVWLSCFGRPICCAYQTEGNR